MEVVLFVPGILGSKLRSPNGEEVWPPTPLEALRGYRRIDKLLRHDLQVSGVVERVCIDVYGSLIQALEGFGYTEGGPRRRLIKYGYDWRRDLIALADELGQTLNALAAQHGPGLEIKLICHSMGGLVARGLLEKPGAAEEPWATAVKLAVFLATPHEGAPLAFARAVGVGGSSLGLNAVELRHLAEAPSFPAGYQLFPPANLLPLSKLNYPTPFKGLSLFDPAVAANYGLNTEHLAAASALHGRLDPARRPVSCRYYAIVSAAHQTITRLDEDQNVAVPVMVKSSGDGTVPIQSASALRVQTAYVEANHVGVTQKSVTHKIVGMLLGALPAEPVTAGFDADLTGASVSMNLSLSERTIEDGKAYEIVVTTAPQDTLDARVRVRMDRNGALGLINEIPINVRTECLERISIKGPSLKPGRYLFDLVADDDRVFDSEELLVTGRDD